MLKDRVKKAMFRVMRPGLLELNQRLERLEAAVGAKPDPGGGGNGSAHPAVFARWRGDLQGRAIDAAGHEVPAMTAQYRTELEFWGDCARNRGLNGEAGGLAESVYSGERRRSIRELGEFLGMAQPADGLSADLKSWCSVRSAVEIGSGPCPAIGTIPWRRGVAVDPLADGYAAEGLLPKDGDEVVFLSSVGEAVPLPAAFADLIVLESSLERAAEPARVLRECVRLLAPGGLMWLLVNLRGDETHPHRFSEATLKEMLRTEGFTIVKDRIAEPNQYRALLRKLGGL